MFGLYWLLPRQLNLTQRKSLAANSSQPLLLIEQQIPT